MFDYLKETIAEHEQRRAQLENRLADFNSRQAAIKRLKAEAKWQSVLDKIDAAFERHQK